MLGLLYAIASSPEVVSAPEQASVLRLLPIALIGRVPEGLSLSSFLNNPQNSIFFGLRKVYVSIVVRDVDDDIEWVEHVSPLSGIPRLHRDIGGPPKAAQDEPDIWSTRVASVISAPSRAMSMAKAMMAPAE